jgi:DNA-binding phage protein
VLTFPVSADIGAALIRDLVDRARKLGIAQSALAESAGISPEQLSRLKRTGACRLSTALALAHAAGLKELTLSAPVTHSAAALAAKKLSAGRRRPISPEILVANLRPGVVQTTGRAHLLGLFEELPIESVHDLVLEEGLEYESLLVLAESLGAEGETIDWLKEMAGDGLAQSA